MKEWIIQKLKEIEKENQVRILLAVESGQPSLGLCLARTATTMSALFMCEPETDYLRLDDVRDVIELPINDVLDINGWDLQKTLRLLYRSNPTLFEWLSSPIVYMETPVRRPASEDYDGILFAEKEPVPLFEHGRRKLP